MKYQNFFLKRFISFIREFVCYLVTFSLLWSNYVWARAPLQIIEEEFEAPRARMYMSQKVGVVDPGVISDGAVHNIFDEFQLPSNSGVVFKGDPSAGAIFNRFYSKDPTHLSGMIQSSDFVPMVLANSKGINVRATSFENIPALDLVAGGIAQTNQGLAYGIDEGVLSLHETVIEEESELKTVALAGRAIQLSQSLILPSEKLDLTAGQHIGVLKDRDDLEHPTAYVAEDAPKFPYNHSILIDPATILRSKILNVRSFDEGVPIHSLGLLESTEEDIHICAKGDIYLHNLTAARNLHIETTGKVYLGAQAYIGGEINIKAKDIYVAKGLSSVGRAFLEASHLLSIQGNFSCENDVSFKGTQNVHLGGRIAAKGRVIAESCGDISQTGFLYASGGFKFNADSFKKRGEILSEGSLEILTAHNIENQLGGISCLSTSRFTSSLGEIINKGQVTSEGEISWNAPKSSNFGLLETQEALHTGNRFVNELKGHIKAKSLSNPLTLLESNKGKVEVSTLTLNTQGNTLRGEVEVHDYLGIKGQGLTIVGNLTSANGVHFDLATLTTKGTFAALGTGASGTINTLTNEGKMHFSSVNATFKDTKNTEKGAMRTQGHFILQGDHYENKGKVFTCGVHQVTLTGTYKDTGTIYSPTLLLLQARNIEYFPGHKSYLKRGIISASSHLSAGAKTQIHIINKRDPYFLQLNSQGRLSFQGKIEQPSTASFPYLEYYNIFGAKPPASNSAIEENISPVSLGPWENLLQSPKQNIALTAGRDMDCQNAVIQPDAGSITLIAENGFNTKDANIKAGYFKGNNAEARGRTVVFDNTKLTSLFGRASVIAKEELKLTNSHISGGEHAEAKAKILRMQGSTVRSKNGEAIVEGSKKVEHIHSTTQGKTSASVTGKNVSVISSQVKSEGTAKIEAVKSAEVKYTGITGSVTVVEAGKTLNLSISKLAGEYNKVVASQVNVKGLETHGETAIKGREKIEINGLKSQDLITAQAPIINLSGRVEGDSLNFEADHLRSQADIRAQNLLRMKGKIVEQLGTTKSNKDSHIEATESYVDTHTSQNEAGRVLTLDAQNNTGFNGHQKADTAILKLNDMNLIALLNQTEARVTEAHLKEGDISLDTDLELKTNLHLWAKRLENKAKLTGNDFIAHMQTTILNQGSMNFHGKALLKAKEGITNLGDVEAGDDLRFETEGTFKHRGNATSRRGTASAKANRIDMDAEVYHTYETSTPNSHTTVKTRKANFIIPTFSGKNVHLESSSSIHARGAQVTSEQDIDLIAKEDIHVDAIGYAESNQEISIDFSQLGIPNLKFTTTTDSRNKFLQTALKAGGNIRAKTAGKFEGKGLKADAGGSIVIDADKGVDVSSLAAVSVVERWNYNTGLFGQNNHQGFREEAEFYRSELTSRNGGIFVIAKQGGITARGTAFQAQEEVRMDARDKVDVGALKATVRYASHDETGLGGFLGSIDDKEGSTERFRQMQALSNKKIGIFSRQGTIEGDAPFMRAPEIELDGEKGIQFKPLEIHSAEDTHHYENNLNINPTNVEFEHKEQHTKTRVMQQIAGTLQTDHLKVRTGQGEKATLTADVSGLKEGGVTDITADTDELAFSGIKSTYDSTTDAWRVAVSVDVNLTPGGSFDVSHDKIHKTNYSATVQKFGTFHNKTKGATLRVEGGAQTSIDKVTGEKLTAIEDKNAQDEEEQDGYSYGASASSTGGGVRASAKWGKLTKADTTTSLNIGQADNLEKTTIEHKEREGDTRGGFGINVTVDKDGKVSANAQVQVGGKKVEFDVPLDGDSLKKVDPREAVNSLKDGNLLDKANKVTGILASANNTLNDLEIGTGDVGNGIRQARQATKVANQAQQTYEQAKSTLQSESFVQALDRGHDTLAQLNTTAQTAGVKTRALGDFVQATHSAKQTAKNAVSFGEKVGENLKPSPSASLHASTSSKRPASRGKVHPSDQEPLAPASDDDSQKGTSTSNEKTHQAEEDKSQESPAAKPVKKLKEKKIQKKPASEHEISQSLENEKRNTEFSTEAEDSDQMFINHVIALKKAEHEREGKSWGEKEEAEAIKEAQKEIGGIEQVTWHEDVLSGGIGFVKSFIKGGIKQAGKFLVTEAGQAAKNKIQEEVEDFVVEGAEELGVDSDTARKVIAATQMTTTAVSWAHKGKKAKSHANKDNSHNFSQPQSTKKPLQEGQSSTFLAPNYFEAHPTVESLNKRGAIRYKGVEIHAVRDISHMSDEEIKHMAKHGTAPYDSKGRPLQLHHLGQKDHREQGAKLALIPDIYHTTKNRKQHPLGNQGGIGKEARHDFEKLRPSFYKELGKQELLKRGISKE